MIGLCGAQRVGKTTLARSFAQEQRMLFLETSTAAIFNAINMDPKADYDLGTRLAIQRVLLTGLCQQYELAQSRSKSPIWITDRTPIDMAAYMIMDVTRANCLTPGMSEAVIEYVHDCFEAANRFFGVLVLVQPGIEPVEAEGKAPAIPAHQEHMNHVVFGMLMDQRLSQRHFFINRSITDLDERRLSLTNAVSATLTKHREWMTEHPSLAMH